VDREAVELVGQSDLAREAAAVPSFGDAQVEQVFLEVARLPDKIAELIAHPHMAGGARVVAPALADDAGHAGAHRSGHDRLAHLADNYTLVAQGADIDHFRHCDLLDSVMA